MDPDKAFGDLITALNEGNNRAIIANSVVLERWVRMDGFVPAKALEAGLNKFGFELLLRSLTTEAIS